jgi:hypothetical protein
MIQVDIFKNSIVSILSHVELIAVLITRTINKGVSCKCSWFSSYIGDLFSGTLKLST